MTYKIHSNQSGFTLIEIIATVVIVSVFSVMMLTLFTDSFIKSSDSLKRILKSSGLSNVMGKINADYIPYPRWKITTSYATGNKVLPTGMNGRFYICTAVTGDKKSGTSEPQWRDYGDTQDGNVTWKAGIWEKTPHEYVAGDIVIPISPNGHFYRCVTGGQNSTEPGWSKTGNSAVGNGAQWKRLLGYLQLQIGVADANLKKDNSYYGKYYVIENGFVKFVSNTIQPIGDGEPENVLQVKIKNDEGETLTALFTAKEN